MNNGGKNTPGFRRQIELNRYFLKIKQMRIKCEIFSRLRFSF